MDYNNVWIFRVMCLNLSLSCFIKHYPEKFHHFLCCNYAEHWRLCAENKIVLDILPERYKPHFTYILSYTTKQRTSSCLLANCLHAISHFNSLPQLLTKSLSLFMRLCYQPHKPFYIVTAVCTVDLLILNTLAAALTVAPVSNIYSPNISALSFVASFIQQAPPIGFFYARKLLYCMIFLLILCLFKPKQTAFYGFFDFE